MDHQATKKTAGECVAHGFGVLEDRPKPYRPDIEQLRPKATKYGITLRQLDGNLIAMEIKDPYGSDKPVSALVPTEIPSWKNPSMFPDYFLHNFRRFFDIRAKDGQFRH